MSVCARQSASPWPRRLLSLLLMTHVWLAIRQLVWRTGFPPRTNHFGFKNILELRRFFDGYTPTWPLVHPGRTTHFYPEVVPIEWWNPIVLVNELVSGRLRPLFQNHADVTYWVEMPHPFFLATVWGEIVGWTVWAIPLVFTGYFLLLLRSLYGIGEAVDSPWTGLSAAAVGGGFPVLFGFGRLVHDTLPIAALATFMIWMALSSDGFRKWGRCVLFGVAGWSMIRSGESFYGSVLGMMVITGPALIEVGHAIRRGMDKRSWVGLALLVGIPVATFDWWWLQPSFQYLQEEDPFGDIAMAPVVADWVGVQYHVMVKQLAYCITMTNDLIRPWMMVWVVLGLVFLVRSPARRKIAISLMFLIPFAALSWMTRKSNWYIVPVAPALALMTVMGLRGLPGRIGEWAVRAAGVAGVVSVLFYSVASDDIRRSIPTWSDRPHRSMVNMREVELVPFKMFAGQSVVNGAEEVIRTLNRVHPADGEQHLMALFCEDQFWAWTFKYYVEMERPDVHVVSLIHINLLEHYAAELDAEEFSYLVHLGDHGVEAWTPEKGTGLPQGMKRPQQEGMDHFGRFMRGLEARTLNPTRMHRGALYALD